ncbi:uncharacterized protein LOC108042581 [Drosophila rhopaloa]|uniref:Uncharacterized protein n=1 Tax=Drosophila rhopaloa TaxID=1041015 RepID=A0ABM5H8M4_DRORH|nr:uncharacterized protein LOC108042581 [Drosophila rhopaloa]
MNKFGNTISSPGNPAEKVAVGMDFSNPEASSICTDQPAATSTPSNLNSHRSRVMALRKDSQASGDSSLVGRIPQTFGHIKGRRPIRSCRTPKKTLSSSNAPGTSQTLKTPCQPKSPKMVKTPRKFTGTTTVKSAMKPEKFPKPASPAAGTSSASTAQLNERKRPISPEPATSTGEVIDGDIKETPSKRALFRVLQVNIASPFSMNRDKQIKSVIVDGDGRSQMANEIALNEAQRDEFSELPEEQVELEIGIQEDSINTHPPEARKSRETSTNTEISVCPKSNFEGNVLKGCNVM